MGRNVKEIVRKLLDQQPSVAVRDVTAPTGLTPQAVHYHLRAMVESGELERLGRGRATRYRRRGEPRPASRPDTYLLERPLRGLEEDVVWRELKAGAPALRELSAPALEVLGYGLTELVNNAIDHSGGTAVWVEVAGRDGRVTCEVRDDGVGLFAHIRLALSLDTNLAALQRLSLGKMTTWPARHTGEGIFFTSKAFDLFEASANEVRWTVDNLRQEHAVGSALAETGTRVRLEMRPDAPVNLQALFDEYTHDHEFSGTRVVVKLFQYGVRFVSRSEAKRLLAGLGGFRQVVFDFQGVESVGQGFADEVFRVWARAHPQVVLSVERANEPIAFMIERARRAAPT